MNFEIISAKTALLMSLNDNDKLELDKIIETIIIATIKNQCCISWTIQKQNNKFNVDRILTFLNNEGYNTIHIAGNFGDDTITYHISWCNTDCDEIIEVNSTH